MPIRTFRFSATWGSTTLRRKFTRNNIGLGTFELNDLKTTSCAMSKFNEEWKVGPHRSLQELDTGLFTVAAEITMPLGNFPRRMTVVGLRGNRSAIWSAVPLRESEMKKIEDLGEPSFLIVPGVGHRLDVKPWKRRYPKALVVCAPGARQAVEEAIAVDATTDILDDPTVALEVVPGVGAKEAALIIRRSGGTTLVLNDILANVRHPHGVGAHIMARLLGFGVSRPMMPRVGRWMFVKDGKALAAAFRKWAKEPELTRIVVSHGNVIDTKPAAVLERIARDLGG
jgi:hypothetical protein